ncbi:Modification methylase DpnIIA [Convivina praedatoris]|uniref:site-specific DNA-methyltransferase (adenine-specific) n=1 Tax=Convivina praedatoris TaxID=2880963 RepID=A0ABN8HAY8_9LACO|nr:Modification methylase DpnIIA [Convivina sp. LMG 32447]CAH1856365.1 Modification methylase DpnIIA [Convivina sp. LMG 32447]CAH1857020.1 Modification methylase DpnIIA [Convivina sp. LMG 32447]
MLDLHPKKAVVNDFNVELVITWKVVRDNPYELLDILKLHEKYNSKDYYLNLRSADRDGRLLEMTDIERAARFIYMVKTGFNGMWRVNKKGQNNIPYGKYKNPLIADSKRILSVSSYLNDAEIKFMRGDFSKSVLEARSGDFVYFDPPYIPVSKTSSFTSYSGEFGYEQQLLLRDTFLELHEKGVFVLLSNSDVPLIDDLYGQIPGIRVNRILANRSISANGTSRGKVGEVLITNVGV